MKVFQYSTLNAADFDGIPERHPMAAQDTRLWNLLALSVDLWLLEEMQDEEVDAVIDHMVSIIYRKADGTTALTPEEGTVAYYMGLPPREALTGIVKLPHFNRLPAHKLYTEQDTWYSTMYHKAMELEKLNPHPVNSDIKDLTTSQSVLSRIMRTT